MYHGKQPFAPVLKGTPALTDAHVPALPAGQGVLSAPGTRVNGHRFADDQTILNQFPDLLTYGKKPHVQHLTCNKRTR